MSKNTIVKISKAWADMINECATPFQISKSRMTQIALKHAYDIDSESKSTRKRDPKFGSTYNLNIPFDDNQLKRLATILDDVKLGFRDITRRSIEKLHADLFGGDIEKTRQIELVAASFNVDLRHYHGISTDEVEKHQVEICT